MKIRKDKGKTKSPTVRELARRELVRKLRTKHGRAGHRGVVRDRTYQTWCRMISRCYNKKLPKYVDYGGRGIIVCEEWKKFESFLEDMGEVSQGQSLERIDVNGNYEPSNCKWIPRGEQANNTRRTHWIEHQGQRLNISQWSKALGIKERTLRSRIARGFPLNSVFSRQSLKNNRNINE